MKLRPSLYLAMLIALTTVGCNAFEFPDFRGGLDAESRSDMSSFDMSEADASIGDGGLPSDLGSDDVGPDMSSLPVDSFAASEPKLRVAMDDQSAKINFDILDENGDPTRCEGGLLHLSNQEFNTVESVDVDSSGDEAFFNSRGPGRDILTFGCDGFEATVQVTVLPTRRAELEDLAVWHRFDLGVVEDSERMISAENLVDGSVSDGVMGNFPFVTQDGAIRFQASNRFELSELLQLRDAEIILVYLNSSSEAASLIGYDVAGNNQIQIPSSSETAPEIALVTTGTPTETEMVGRASWQAVDLTTLLIYRFRLRFDNGTRTLSVTLSLDGMDEVEQSILLPQTIFAGPPNEYFFPVKNFGSFGERLYALGKLYEVIIFDGPIGEPAWGRVSDYLRRRYQGN